MDTLKNFPNYDYLSDIQEILLEMDESSASEILVLLGEELIITCCTGIIDRAFRCLGTELQEFLGSLDGVYDVLKLQEVRNFTGENFFIFLILNYFPRVRRMIAAIRVLFALAMVN